MINGTPFAYADSFFAKAIERLNQESGGPIRSEVVSLGGFPAPRAVKHFKKRVLSGKPDIVVLQFGSGDAAVPIQKKIDSLSSSSRKARSSIREDTSHINDDRITWRHVLKWEIKSLVGLLLRMPPVTSQEKYLEAIRQIIAEAKETNTTLIVLSPFVFGSRLSALYAKRYTAALREEIAHEHDIHLLDAYTELSKFPRATMLCHEGFHISRRAHDVVARQLADLITTIRTRKAAAARDIN